MGMLYLFAALACVVFLAVCFAFLFSNSGPNSRGSDDADDPQDGEASP